MDEPVIQFWQVHRTFKDDGPDIVRGFFVGTSDEARATMEALHLEEGFDYAAVPLWETGSVPPEGERYLRLPLIMPR